MKNIKLIIFDLDGTLVDAYPAIIDSFNHVMRIFKYPKQRGLIIRRAVGWGDERLLKPFIKKEDLPGVVSLYRKHHARALIKDSRLLPGAKSLLSRLKKRGIKLAVATNRPTKFSKILIRHLKIDKYFDYLLCGDKLKQGKPHPEILLKILHRFRLKAEDALYIGDMIVDIRAGRRARVKTIAIPTGSNTRGELKKEKPYRIINDLSALFKVLR